MVFSRPWVRLGNGAPTRSWLQWTRYRSAQPFAPMAAMERKQMPTLPPITRTNHPALDRRTDAATRLMEDRFRCVQFLTGNPPIPHQNLRPARSPLSIGLFVSTGFTHGFLQSPNWALVAFVVVDTGRSCCRDSRGFPPGAHERVYGMAAVDVVGSMMATFGDVYAERKGA